MSVSASRIVPLRRMTPKPTRPPAPVGPALFIPDATPWLPQTKGGWWFCGLLAVFDVAPVVFLFWRFW